MVTIDTIDLFPLLNSKLLSYLKSLSATDWQRQLSGMGNEIARETIINGDIAWKLFSKSIRKHDVPKGFLIKGMEQLAGKVLDMVSVMA